jgi:alanine-synthesizing transaminase
MGNPDLPTPKHIVDKLVETSASRAPTAIPPRGHPGLRRAQAAYYERRFGVKLNPDTQVVATLGSKEGFANMAQAITAPGDVVLVPEPELSDPRLRLPDGGRRHPLVPVEPDAGLLPRARARGHAFDPEADRGGRLLSVEPDRLCRDLDFYGLVAFAKKHDLIILSDLAYAEIYFDGNPPPSILQVPGAMDVAVEFTSMSKTFSMAGWRMGFAVGNERLIAALARVKSYLDYGAFTPIQVAAPPRSTARGLHRRDARDLQAPPRRAGRELRPRRLADSGAAASMFAWAPIPEPFAASRQLEFSKLLVEKADVAVAPGIGFGEHGDGYVRIALVENEQRIRQAARNIRRFLDSADKTLHNVVRSRPRR